MCVGNRPSGQLECGVRTLASFICISRVRAGERLLPLPHACSEIKLPGQTPLQATALRTQVKS